MRARLQVSTAFDDHIRTCLLRGRLVDGGVQKEFAFVVVYEHLLKTRSQLRASDVAVVFEA
jgi:hypothetical protein